MDQSLVRSVLDNQGLYARMRHRPDVDAHLRSERRVELWGVATAWLIAHACFHFWEVAVGICAPSAIPRDFAGVTLPAILGVIVTLWAIDRSDADRRS